MATASTHHIALIAASTIVFGVVASGCGLYDIDPEKSALPIVINELLAKSETSTDWIELANLSDEEIDLAGMTLSDSTDDWIIPEGAVLPPLGYWLVYCDGTGEAGNTTFKLSSAGETISIRGLTGEVIDKVGFGEQADDISWARVPDGTGPWQASTTPSPNAANQP